MDRTESTILRGLSPSGLHGFRPGQYAREPPGSSCCMEVYMALGCSKFLKKTQWEKIVMCILRKVFIGLTQNFDRNTPLCTSFTNSIYVTHFCFIYVEMFSILVFRFRFSNEANSKNNIFFYTGTAGKYAPRYPL